MTRWIAAATLALGIVGAGVYWGFGPGATPAAAADYTAVEALRDGQMRKLMFHADPQPLPDTPFETAEGGTLQLADFAGRYTLVNFWATWCAPCRHEMPSLSRLQEAMGGDRFAVVTIATGRNAPEAIARFFDEIEVTNLPQHRDVGGALARQMGIAGLPITVLLDPEGREVARLIGDAEWDTDSAKAIVAALTAD